MPFRTRLLPGGLRTIQYPLPVNPVNNLLDPVSSLPPLLISAPFRSPLLSSSPVFSPLPARCGGQKHDADVSPRRPPSGVAAL